MAAQASEQSIFLHAIGLPSPADRAAYLEEACRDNPALRAELEALLAAHDRLGGGPVPTGQQPGQNVPADSEATTCNPSVEAVGMFIANRYKLLEPIGEGGMGVVWMAQQTEPVKRLVAIKLIKPGMDSKQVLARFEAERQALALMDHPNIAKVLDAGAIGEPGRVSAGSTSGADATGLARPYFVMELVKGVPITRYCDEHHLTPRQRLELFVPVCQAIQHAHQKGIIHRDLKPSNVLVALYDDKPVPKVIDFGVAKATGSQLTEQTLHTGFGAVIGTVEYMSPEQACFNALDVDTRSDIYSLGVLLYELLAGSPPFGRKELEKAGMLEMLRVIREQEPSKPSTKLSTADGLPTLAANRGTEPAKLTRLVRGELDWIVMKALEKDRARRYETANGFAMDLQRYLADEPVQACPPSIAYRFRKFARRNRVVLTAAALLVTMLLVGSVISTWQAVRATKAEGLARKSLAAERTALEEAVAAQKSAEEQRQRAQENMRLAYQSLDEISMQVAEKWPILGAFTDHHEARKLIEKAMGVYEAFVQSNKDDPAVRVELAKAFLRLAGIQHSLKRPRKSEEAFRRAIALFEELDREPASGNDHRAYLEDCYIGLGRQLYLTHRHQESEKAYRKAVVIGEKLLAERADAQARIKLAATLNSLALVRRDQGDLVDCRDLLLRAIDNLQLAEKVDPAINLDDRRVGYREARRDYYRNLADTHVRLGDHQQAAKAVTELTRLWAINEQAFQHCTILLAECGAIAAKDAGLSDVKRKEFSEQYARRVKQFVQSAVGAFADGSNDVAWFLATHPNPLIRDPAQAISLAKKLVERQPGVGLYWTTLGVACYRAGDWQGATRALQNSLFLRGPKFGHNAYFLAMAHWRQANREEARQWYERATKWTEQNALANDDLWQVGAEAAKLLGLQDKTLGMSRPRFTERAVLYGHAGPVRCVAFSPDGKTLATASFDNTAKLWDVATCTLRLTLQGHADAVNMVAFAPDGGTLATAGLEGVVKLWDTSTGKELATLKGHQGRVLCVAFARNGNFLASGAEDGIAKVWDVTKRTECANLDGGKAVECMVFAPDGKTLATGNWGGHVKLWDVGTWKEIATLQETSGAWGLAFSSDGKTLASGAGRSNITLWDVTTRQSRARFLAQKGIVYGLAFSPDNNMLVSASCHDDAAKVWDVASNRLLAVLGKHQPYGVWSVAFSSDGKILALASADETVSVWNVEVDQQPPANKPASDEGKSLKK